MATRTAYTPKKQSTGISQPKPSKKKAGAQMSTKRSTPAVVVDKDSSVRVEEIENGYLVSESGTKGSGKNKEWYEKRYFSSTNPVEIKKPSLSFSGKKK